MVCPALAEFRVEWYVELEANQYRKLYMESEYRSHGISDDI
jgi:hypothetical protein